MTSNDHNSEHHDNDSPESITMTHFGGRLLVPGAAVAAALSTLHSQGMGYAIGAVVAWLLTFSYLSMAVAHDWRACPRCHTPPRSLATPTTRARLAKARHRLWTIRLNKLVVIAVLMHAVLPKPYMGPWWTKVIAGIVYFLVAIWTAYIMVRSAKHRLYHEECHLEWCRAGRKFPPGETWKLRRARWVAHHGVWLIAALAPVACALGLYATQHPSLWLRISYGIAVFLLGWTTLDMSLLHPSEPCLRCVRSLPDKPEEAAERRHPWLRLFHRSRFFLIGGSVLAWIASWALAGTIAAKVLVCAAALALVCWAVLDRLHSPVKPWCPWCKDDGGEEEEADVPDPSTSVPSPA